MREDVYQRIVQAITWHHSWITVQDADRYEPRSVVREGRSLNVVCCIMVLRVVYNRGQYKRGQRVGISEYELANALADCRKEFLQHRDRREKPPFVIDRHAVEDIIHKATHGLIKLELYEYPVHRPYNYQKTSPK